MDIPGRADPDRAPGSHGVLLKQGYSIGTKAALTASCLGMSLLAGCSGRDTVSAERLAAMNAAAARAEAAADRAEKAAAKLGAAPSPAPTFTEEADDPAPDDDTGDTPADSAD